EPQILFLDEPFGALDALTRGTLQQELAAICSNRVDGVTTIMITNNVEEAILLSDRIVPMTKGPRAMLGAAVRVNRPNPRTVWALIHDEDVEHVRPHVVECLTSYQRPVAQKRQVLEQAPLAVGLLSVESE